MNESIELHTIGTFRGKEYEMQDILNGLLEEINKKDIEIGRLTAESTEWESRFYDEAKK